MDDAARHERPAAEAITLYERLGFTRIGPYYELPDELVDWLVFMELSLQPSP